jgi:hypothetical protein
MIAKSLVAMTLAVSATAVAASPVMTAGQFLQRAEPLMKKSKVSLIFSSEARTLLRTVGEAAQRNRDRLDSDRAAGRSVGTCLPPKGKSEVNAEELLAYLRSLSPQQKAQSFETAFAGYTARKYPCRG